MGSTFNRHARSACDHAIIIQMCDRNLLPELYQGQSKKHTII